MQIIKEVKDRTTSACAENTTPCVYVLAPCWNYLRVRGEYSISPQGESPMPELPPRARRIRGADQEKIAVIGTTSACAENTHIIAHNQRHPRNYLRVRGEYPK